MAVGPSGEGRARSAPVSRFLSVGTNLAHDGVDRPSVFLGGVGHRCHNTRDQTTNITPSGGTAIAAGYLGRGQTERTSFDNQTFLNDKLGIGRQTISGGATTDFGRDPAGTTLSENVGGTRYYFAFDGLGSVVGLFDSNGNYCHDGGTNCQTGGTNYTAIYDPYGKLTNEPTTSYPALPIRFAGYWWDAKTRLYKVGLRYYDPDTGRWTQRDPIDNPFELHGWNRYIYAGDDPANFTDPTGLFLRSLRRWANRHAGDVVAGVGAGCTIASVAQAGLNPFTDLCAVAADSAAAAIAIHDARRDVRGRGAALVGAAVVGVGCDVVAIRFARSHHPKLCAIAAAATSSAISHAR